MSGKGSKQRPRSVAFKEFSERWEATFGRCNCYYKDDEKPSKADKKSKSDRKALRN